MGKNSSIIAPTNSGEIYEGGTFSPIGVKDLLNNEVAIKQLLNDFQQKNKEIESNRATIKSLNMQIAASEMSWVLLLISIICNVIGSILVGCGSKDFWYLWVLGAILVLFGTAAPAIESKRKKAK